MTRTKGSSVVLVALALGALRCSTFSADSPPGSQGADGGDGGGDATLDGTTDGAAPGFGAVRVIADQQVGALGIAVDDGNVYWTRFVDVNGADGTVSAIAKAGGDVRVLATGQRKPIDVQVGPTQIYFLEQVFDGNLQVLDKNGSGPPTPVAASWGNVLRMTSDAQALYVLNPVTVNRVPFTTLLPTMMFPNSGEGFTAIASNGGSLFLGAAAAIDVAALGSAPAPFAANQPQAVDVVVDATTVYWATIDGTVAKLDADQAGAPPTILATKQAGIRRLAQDATTLFWTTASLPGNGSVVTIPKGGGLTSELASSLQEPAGIAVDASGVYFVDHGAGKILVVPR